MSKQEWRETDGATVEGQVVCRLAVCPDEDGPVVLVAQLVASRTGAGRGYRVWVVDGCMDDGEDHHDHPTLRGAMRDASALVVACEQERDDRY